MAGRRKTVEHGVRAVARSAWRRQAPPLLYTNDGRSPCIVVAALASAMPVDMVFPTSMPVDMVFPTSMPVDMVFPTSMPVDMVFPTLQQSWSME